MMGRLLARQREEMKAVKEEIKARKDQLKQDVNGHTEACLEGLRSWGKGTTICKVASEACPEKSKAGLEETKAVVKRQELLKR
jgi:predicted  nucleic acid-binding Zn-ribbon protein